MLSRVIEATVADCSAQSNRCEDFWFKSADLIAVFALLFLACFVL